MEFLKNIVIEITSVAISIQDCLQLEQLIENKLTSGDLLMITKLDHFNFEIFKSL
jgi:hypothetical protein